MESRTPQYQRAVTPTIDGGAVSGSNSVRGKVLSYNSSFSRTGGKVGGASAVNVGAAIDGRTRGGQSTQQVMSPRLGASHSSLSQDINVQGRSSSARGPALNMGVVGRTTSLDGSATAWQPEPHASPLSVATRYDLIPLSEDLPPDGIIFAKIKNAPDSLVVIRTPEERLRNPERLNLDRRQLDVCPILEQEQRLRLLNFQNNNIRTIQNLENLPNLIFLDLYNNKITSLDGPLSMVKGLRVLMAGKNKISTISNLNNLRKLDVLDLHSNEIKKIDGLDGLADLRVLNLAGNKICSVANLTSLVSLTELNLRRNSIDHIDGLNKLPALQRVFLSHNQIIDLDSISCVLSIQYLIELSLDGNPVSEVDPVLYRKKLVVSMPGLRHLDLRRVTEEERNNAQLCDAGGRADSSERLTHFHSSNDLADHPPAALRKSHWDQTSNHTQSDTNEANDTQVETDVPISMNIRSSSDRHGDMLSSHSDADPRSEIDSKLHNAANTIPDQPSLTELARSGRLPLDEDIFDIEEIDHEEKSLIAVGDNREWTCSRRLLQNVTEMTLCNISGPSIIAKIGPTYATAFPSLKTLRLQSNGFKSIKSIDFIPRFWAAHLEHIQIDGSPMCHSPSMEMIQCFLVAAMPKLLSFNNKMITDEERDSAEEMYAPLLKLHQCASMNLGAGAAVRPVPELRCSPSKSDISVAKAHQQQQQQFLRRRTLVGSMYQCDRDDGIVANKQLASGNGVSNFLDSIEGNNAVGYESVTIGKEYHLSSGLGSSAMSSQMSKRSARQKKLNAEFDKSFEQAIRRIVTGTILSQQINGFKL